MAAAPDEARAQSFEDPLPLPSGEIANPLAFGISGDGQIAGAGG